MARTPRRGQPPYMPLQALPHYKPEPPASLRPPPDPLDNPFILECSCGCMSRSRQCRLGRKLMAERREREERRILRDSLTAEDLAWLAGHGWTP